MNILTPQDVPVNRTIEDRWSAMINEVILPEWGPDEMLRRVDLPGKFLDQSGLVNYLVDRYRLAGWRVSSSAPFKAPDKFTTITFQRPGSVFFGQYEDAE